MPIFDENTAQKSNFFGGLGVTEAMKRNWMSISKWALFFSILGFIYVGLSVLMLGSIGTIFQIVTAMGDENQIFAIIAPYLTYITALSGGVLVGWFFINLYHLNFANQIQRAVKNTDQRAFESAWKSLRNHFRVYGILTCILILLYLIVFVVVVKTATASSELSSPMY
jgi:hypothetical protein